MEAIIEDVDQGEWKHIDEVFSWDEQELYADEVGLYNEFEKLAVDQRPHELPDYANDIRYKLKQLLSLIETHKPRYTISRMSPLFLSHRDHEHS